MAKLKALVEGVKLSEPLFLRETTYLILVIKA